MTRLITAILCLATFAGGCTTYQPLDVALVGIEPLPSSMLEQRMRLQVRVLNPNDRVFDASGLSLQLNVNGQRLAQAVTSEPIVVPRLGETRVFLEASTTLFDLARQFLVLRDGAQALSYEVEGKLHGKGLRPDISFSKRGQAPWAPAGGR